MKTKNGRTTNQDYMNLLYSETDSDDPPDLKLPPLNKSKKSRKKRGTLLLKTPADQISDISNCSGVTFLKIFVIVVLLAAAAVFGVVTFWLMRQVADLKEQVDLIFKLEQTTKVDVDFKPGKRMKKRRQLDALVSNGKLPRRKSKSGHELLRSNDSDSSEIEEFAQPFDKKGCFRSISCSACSPCLILIVLVTLMACIVASAGLIWMHFELKRDLDNLRDRLLTVESHNKQGNEEFIKIQSDLKDINKSIDMIKLENINLQINLTQMAVKYKSLTDKSSSLMTKLNTLKDLKKLSQIDTLSATTASVGSDIKDLKANIEPAVEDLKKRIAVLENKEKSEIGIDKAKNTTLTDSTLTSITEQLSSLNNDVDSLNKSIISTISSLKGNITTRVGLLENSISNVINTVNLLNTEQPTHPGNTVKTLKPQISAIIQEMLKNKEIKFTDSGEILSNLQIQVSNLTSVIDDLLFNHSQISEKSMILNANPSIEIKNIQSQTMNLNKTVIKLNEDVDQLFSKLTSNTNKLVRVSSIVDGLRHYIANRENISLSSLEDINMITASLTESTSPSIPSLTTVTTKPVISLPGIKSYTDLQNKYSLWPKLGYNLKQLKSVKPEIIVPTEEYMKPFDKNKDGLYTLEEFGNALGLSHSDVPEDLLNNP